MNPRYRTVALTALALVAGAALATAAPGDPEPPRLIPYQGVLEMNGAAATTAVAMDFTLSDGAGSETWTEPHPAVTVTDGRFSVRLGSVDAGGVPGWAFRTSDLRLSVTVDGVALGNEQRIDAVPFAVRAANGVPAGSVIPFAGSLDAVPPGWLLCDGQSYDPTDPAYAALFAAVQTTYGGDGATTFAVPDYRGTFLRGVDDRAVGAVDADAPRAVGTLQGFTTAEPVSGPWKTSNDGAHKHDIYYHGDNPSNTGATLTRWDGGTRDSNPVTTHGSNHNHTIVGGDAETRPVNIAVHYLIKL